MPGFKDFVSLTPLTESDLDDLLMKQVVMKFASVAARTAALAGQFRAGIVTILDDLRTIGVNTGATDVHSTIGPVYGALTSWTPTLAQSAVPTISVTSARYTRTGRWVSGYCEVAVTSGTGTASNAIVMGLPVAHGLGANTVIGTGYFYDSSLTKKYAFVLVAGATSTTARGYHTSDSNDAFVGANSGVTVVALAVNDVVVYKFDYECSGDS